MTDPEDLRLVTVPRDLYYVEHALVQDQAAEITRLRAERAALRARVETLEDVLKPFALVAERDIGESEDDVDTFRPMSREHAAAPLLTVGDLRAARTAHKEKNDGQV